MAIHKSCSNCRRRKIKCDKSDKLQDAVGQEVVCSPCSAAKIRCEDEVVQPRKPSNGKRLREIRQEQGLGHYIDNDKGKKAIRTVEDGRATPSTSSQIDQLSVFNEQVTNPGFSSISSFSYTRALPGSSSSQANRKEHQGLLGINGLTRPLLEACVTQFFVSVSPCQPICRPDHFYPRYQAFLASQDPNYLTSTSALASSPISPTGSELSILAVACVGSGHLDLSSTSDGVVENELRKKFELREALHRALQIKLHANGGEMVKKDPLDAIEACYLLYSIEADLSQDGLIQNEKLNIDESGESVLSIKPTTLSGVIKLLYDNGLNKKPDPNLSAAERLRHTRLFWACLIADSFYSLATRKQLLVAEDSFDVDLPKWIPSRNPIPGIPESKSSNLAHDHVWSNQQRFEMQWVASILRLSFIARDLNRPFVSTRAQSRGIRSQEVLKAIGFLQKWWDERPRDLIFEAENQRRYLSVNDLKDNQVWRNRMKSFYLEVSASRLFEREAFCTPPPDLRLQHRSLLSLATQCLYHAVVFGLYFALNDFGFFDPQDQDPGETLAQSTSQIESKEKLNDLTLQTYHRLISLLPTASSEGMVRANTNVCRPAVLCVALYGCEKAEISIKKGFSSSEIETELKEVEMAIRCLSTADSSKTTPALVSVAKGGVAKVREVLNAREKQRNGSGPNVREESIGWKSVNSVIEDHDVELSNLFEVGRPLPEESVDGSRSGSGTEESLNGWSPDDLPEFLDLDELISSENQNSVPDWLTTFSGMSEFNPSASSSFNGGIGENFHLRGDHNDLSSFSQFQMGTGPVNWNDSLDDALTFILREN